MTHIVPRTGLRPWAHDPNLFKLNEYVEATKLPTVPATHNRTLGAGKNWGMLGNDRYGDCYFAGQGHYEMLMNKVEKRSFNLTDQQVIDAYFAYTGGSDDGTDPVEALGQWRKNGLWGRPPITAYLSGDPAKFAEEVPLIDYMFGTCGLAIALPSAIQTNWGFWPIPPADWNTNPKWRPWSWGGHYVITHGYNKTEKYVNIVTWGQNNWRVPFEFLQSYLVGTFAVVSPDWLNKNQKTPQGFNIDKLQKTLASL